MKKYLLILLIILLLTPTMASAFISSCDMLEGDNAYKLCKLMERIATVLYMIAGGIALIIILYGGISIMTAGANEDKLNKGKKVITYGLIGAAIVFSSGFILELLTEFLFPLTV